MKISVRPYGFNCAEITVEGNGMKYTEDVISGGKVDENLVEDLITAARELSNRTGMSDLEFVKMVAEAFLDDSEREQLIEAMKGKP